ncbi:hypothetical protein HYV81_06145 [Candidatus Woesearchaeota archaeon]|nr:hypothetical protein [Candidatus Woesearchaeota archaeon]
MEMEITSKKHNRLLSRTEVQVNLPYPAATPSLPDVKKTVAHLTKSAEDVIIIRRVANRYGEKSALVTAYVYDSKEAMDKIEPKPRQKKVDAKAETPAAAAPAPAAK